MRMIRKMMALMLALLLALGSAALADERQDRVKQERAKENGTRRLPLGAVC